MDRALRILVLLCFALIAPHAGLAQNAAPNTAQTTVHLLDYIGVDYAGAVEDGKVKSEDEFKEMVEFAGQVAASLKTLPANPRQPALIAEADKLAGMVQAKAPAAAVAAAASKLRWALIAAYGVVVAPRAAPDLAAGAKLYESSCAGCHGVAGRGDGPAAAKLDPPPSNFHDRSRMGKRSAYGLYNTITLGVAGTGMAPYPQLTDEERWALAFHVATLPAAEEQARGEKLWRDGAGRQAFPDLRAVATLSADEVRERYGPNEAAVQAYLLAHPEALAGTAPAPLAFARQTLDAAMAAYRKGDTAAAQRLAIRAYLEGYELKEASLKAIDAPLVQQTEREMMALRALIARSAPAAEVEAQGAAVQVLLERAEEKLGGATLSAGATFLSAFLTLLREGLEAILVLAAIIAYVVRTGRRDALPYVHAGWVSALVLGAATWFAAGWLIEISGADRETTEGVTALIASAILLYVGLWLHGKGQSQGWRSFLGEQVSTALERRTLWAMAAVSFLAVYREIFETVLFYEALWAQAGAEGRPALFGGFAAAAAALLVIGWAIFKSSLRLPLRLFFSATSILIAALAVVFAGQGTAALQEAGHIPVHSVSFVSLPVLGIFPTVQTLAAQLAVIVMLAAGYWLAGRRVAP